MIDKDLIDKFYQGACTEAEVYKVLSWFHEQQEGERHIEDLWNHPIALETPHLRDPGKTLAAIRQRIGLEERHSSYRMLRTLWFRVAAILAIAFILPLLMVNHEPPSASDTMVVQYVTKENPAGRQSTLQLPDGSVVNLNAESRITYPENFDDSIRNVSLVGEAFFEVAENKNKPFIVSAAGVDTRALGTSFNVKAYEEDEQVQVVLASGKVKVTQSQQSSEEVFLNPGEEVRVEKQTHKMTRQPADLYQTLAWKDNIIVFHQAPAEQVFATLERWYGVTITFPEKLRDDSWRFTGEFRNENLENVLLSISYIKGFHYQINQHSVIITP